MHGIALVGVDGLQQRLHHVCEGDVPAAALQERPDEPAPDVAGAKHNCLFHFLLLTSRQAASKISF
jgi:hypothetical protein